MLLASSSSSGSNFLIPNGTFVFELIIFIIVLGIVAKFILPSLQKVMADRDATIRSSLQASDEGRIEAERLDAERVAVLEQAHSEARVIIEGASLEVERLREKAQQRGTAKFETDVAQARTLIFSETKQLREESIARLDEVVVAAAERIVGITIDRSKHRSSITAVIREINSGRPV